MPPFAPAWVAVALAVGAAFAGMACLRGARAMPPGGARRAAATAAAALPAGALAALVAAAGWAVAVPASLGLLTLAGFCIALFAGLRAARDGKAKATRLHRGGAVRSPDRPPDRPSALPLPALTLPAAFAGGLCLSAALVLALARHLPLPAIDRALLSVLLWPALWAVAALLLATAQAPRRSWLAATGATLLAAATALPL